MNLFEKYGIKEVADVVFYSINQIGDDEIIYTPVLFLDTLKVSTYEKSAESVFATGGLKNKNLIKWNFGKNIRLSLEDALFSPASMSLIWGGKLNSKLSDATSLVSKINFANTYGRLQYSPKAYPSPALTKNEWEIVFKIIGERMGIDHVPADYDGNSWILDTTYYSKLSDEYKSAFRKRYATRPYLFNGVEDITDTSWTYSYDKKNFITNFKATYLEISMMQIEGYEGINDHYDSNGNLKAGHEKWYQAKALPEYIVYRIRQEISELNQIGKIDTNIQQFETIDRMEKCLVEKKGGLTINGKEQLDNLFRYYADDKSSSYTIYYDIKTMLPIVQMESDKLADTSDIITKQWIVDELSLSMENNTEAVRNQFATILTALAKTHSLINRNTIMEIDPNAENDSEEILGDSVDECIRVNLASYLNASKYQGKTWTKDDITDYIFEIRGYGNPKEYAKKTSDTVLWLGGVSYIDFKSNKTSDYFKIKYGTSYYKWTRTVKYKEYEDDGILGTSFIIDADTFPADYKIVGETYIRNQKTGKDQRYQITIFKANISSDTSITLQADGDPTTFNMDIDVLTPENDIMMEMRQIDIEEDRFEGGTRILPQRGKYTYTPTIGDEGEVLVPIDNNEIY